MAGRHCLSLARWLHYGDAETATRNRTVWIGCMKKLSRSTLRWYIGTKSLMPMSEIRRRFGINGDEVTVVQDEDGRLYIGLPEQVADVLEDLRQQGKVGYELSADHNARILIGVYAILKKTGESEQEATENAA